MIKVHCTCTCVYLVRTCTCTGGKSAQKRTGVDNECVWGRSGRGVRVNCDQRCGEVVNIKCRWSGESTIEMVEVYMCTCIYMYMNI